MSFVEERFGLAGKVALVTGSRRGLGRTIADGLARAGATVVVNARDEAALDQAVSEMRRDGRDAHAAAFDVTDGSAALAAVEVIEQSVGPIDILVNNAGIQIRAPLEDFDDADWAAIISTNLTSIYNVGRAAARRMIPRGQGKIINICSVQSELGRPSIAPYTASKGAVKMLTKTGPATASRSTAWDPATT
jgi:gluconate 5-dehydrogenase